MQDLRTISSRSKVSLRGVSQFIESIFEKFQNEKKSKVNEILTIFHHRLLTLPAAFTVSQPASLAEQSRVQVHLSLGQTVGLF